MVKASPIECEVFVHGAMCMSMSGQCMMSAFLGGRSGNRGACAGPCRLPFDATNGLRPGQPGKACHLSLKDMDLVPHMAQLKAAGVASIKIEGRLRSINPKEFKELRKNEAYTLVDVRTPGEFKNCHIAGCCNIVNLPLDEVRSECCKVLPDKDARLVCSCQIDLRGYEAETMLRAQGYKNVQGNRE